MPWHTSKATGSTYFLIFSGLWHPQLLILFKRIPAALQSTSLIDACRSGTKQSLVCPQVYRGWEGQYGISKCCRVSFSLQRRQCAASWLGSNNRAWWKHCPISLCISVLSGVHVFLHVSFVSSLAGVYSQPSVNKCLSQINWDSAAAPIKSPGRGGRSQVKAHRPQPAAGRGAFINAATKLHTAIYL